MSLIKCHECASQVSTEAKHCPQCGASVRKPISLWRLLLILLIGAVAYRCTSTVNDIETRSRTSEAAMTPEQRVATEKLKREADKRFSLARSAVRALKQQVKDPASLKVDSIHVDEPGDLACVVYRARNSFNAVVPGLFAFDGSTGTDNQKVVTKFCGDKKRTFINVSEAI